jgi:hypothetical protein
MRAFLFISLATAVACQDTETEIASDDAASQQGTVEAGDSQVEDESQDWQIRDDFAGGIDQGLDQADFVDQIEDPNQSDDPDADEWGPAPMAPGVYMGTVELVMENTCGPLTEGDSWDSKLRINDEGETTLGGGALESNGDQVRINRLKESALAGTVDCVQVEFIQGGGTMFTDREMELEMMVDVHLEGTDCPVLDPCTDSYMAYMEHSVAQ